MDVRERVCVPRAVRSYQPSSLPFPGPSKYSRVQRVGWFVGCGQRCCGEAPGARNRGVEFAVELRSGLEVFQQRSPVADRLRIAALLVLSAVRHLQRFRVIEVQRKRTVDKCPRSAGEFSALRHGKGIGQFAPDAGILRYLW